MSGHLRLRGCLLGGERSLRERQKGKKWKSSFQSTSSGRAAQGAARKEIGKEGRAEARGRPQGEAGKIATPYKSLGNICRPGYKVSKLEDSDCAHPTTS